MEIVSFSILTQIEEFTFYGDNKRLYLTTRHNTMLQLIIYIKNGNWKL